MKILHTADWHIGKSLYKRSLEAEFNLFFEWLVDLIEVEQVDVLIVAGDIFDLANPSHHHKTLYYDMLFKIQNLDVQIVITAGNHDSPTLLEGPKSLIHLLKIHVVGHGHQADEQIIHISSEKGDVTILAVPYLRDSHLGITSQGLSYEEKVKATRDALVNHYLNLSSQAKSLYPDTPIIGMGHLYVQGASTSDSEREIHIGHQAAVSVSTLESICDYLALGHIHRPQQLNKSNTVCYSGSPIPLSFSERSDQKSVQLIVVDEGHIATIQKVDIPTFRSLVRIKGPLADVKKQLGKFVGMRLSTIAYNLPGRSQYCSLHRWISRSKI